MKEIWHHTRHDLGRMRWWLLLWFAFALASLQRFPVAEVPFLHSYGSVVFLFFLSLMLARQHLLVGDRVWWATRPICRERLAVSKLLSLLLIVVLWLIGGGIRLAFEGFHPLAIALFQVEAIPLTMAVGLGALILCGFSRTWRGLAMTLLIGTLAVLYASIAYVGWSEQLMERWTKSHGTMIAAHLHFHYFGRWLEFGAESGFVGGLSLCAGFWIAARFRFRERHRLGRAILGMVLTVVAAQMVKTSLLPGRLPRLSTEQSLPISSDPLVATVEEGAVELLRRNTRDLVKFGRISEEYVLRANVNVLNADTLAETDTVAVDAELAFRSPSERDHEEGELLLTYAPAIAGLNEQGSLRNALGAPRGPSVPRAENKAAFDAMLPGISADRLSGRSVSISLLQPHNPTFGRVMGTKAWSTLPFESGSRVAEGIHRVEIIDAGTGGGSITWEDSVKVHEHYFRAKVLFQELRFRLSLNPGNLLFSEPQNTVWQAVLTDKDLVPLAPLESAPYLAANLGSKSGVPFSYQADFLLPSKPAGLSIVRRIPKGKRLFQFEARTITLPEIIEEK